jgi:adenosylmethionine---8-amino-7-oxononanoate aminotransferase
MSDFQVRDTNVVWHPYTQAKIAPDNIAIVSGEGVYLIDEAGNKYIDAIASWWVNLHGHAHHYIANSVSSQLRTLEHCIFAGFTHEPAITLAERLIAVLPGDMAKIFYSDNGSTAVEVAIKMAVQYWANKGQKRNKLVAIADAYHGDTFGAMAVSGRSIFTQPFNDLLFDVAFIPFPARGQENESIHALKELLSNDDVAALIVEPLVQGTAGMRMYSPEVLNEWFSLCHRHDALIIADEVMTGFGRTGKLFACHYVEEKPDIICLSKGLTGGTMPMGVTACTRQIFDAFYSEDRSKTLYHGHSYTANPVACSAAHASLDLLLTDICQAQIAHISSAHKEFAQLVAGNHKVADVRHCGTILAIELKSTEGHYLHPIRDAIYNFFLDKNIIMRPLGNIFYMMPPYCITEEQLRYVYNAIHEFLEMAKV